MTGQEGKERLTRWLSCLSVGNVLTLVALVGAGFAAWNAQSNEIIEAKSRLVALEKSEITKQESVREMKNDLKGEIKDVKQDVRELNHKIDMLLDTQRQGRDRGRDGRDGRDR